MTDRDDEMTRALVPREDDLAPWAADEEAEDAEEEAEDVATPRPGLPQIEVHDRPQREITHDSGAALAKANDPLQWFAVEGLPVRLRQTIDERGVPRRPVVQPITPQGLTSLLHRVADFRRTTRKESLLVPVPSGTVSDFYGVGRFEEVFPELRGVISSPTFVPDGTLVATEGYHAGSRLFYAPPAGERPIPPPKLATAATLREAVALLLEELLGDFPFVDPASRANALALLLLGFTRPLIEGPTPLHVLNAPKVEGPGTGKSLLAQATAAPSAPEGVSFMVPPTHEAEWRKALTAALRDWPTHLVLDNVSQPLQGAALASALTADVWADRLLGSSTQAKLPVRCVWMATGNGVRASREIQRRICWIGLDQNMREGGEFRHEPLLPWARENRPRLGQAALTIIQGWLDAGRPMGEVTIASYEGWARVMGGILAFAGVEGFLANYQAGADLADPDEESWAALVAAWAAAFRDAEVTSAQLFELARAMEATRPLTGQGEAQNRKVYFGKRLTMQADRTYSGFRITRTREVQNSWRYRLVAA